MPPQSPLLQIRKEIHALASQHKKAEMLEGTLSEQNTLIALNDIFALTSESRRNCSALGIIGDVDAPMIDPSFVLGKFQRTIYQKASKAELNHTGSKERVEQLKDVKALSDPSWGQDINKINTSLSVTRDFLNEYFQRFTNFGLPIIDMSRNKLHIAMELSTDANTIPDISRENQGILYDMAKRIVHAAYDEDDLVSPITFDDCKMISKGYAAWAIQAVKDGKMPADPESLKLYAQKIFKLYTLERQDKRDFLFDTDDASTVIPKDDGSI